MQRVHRLEKNANVFSFPLYQFFSHCIWNSATSVRRTIDTTNNEPGTPLVNRGVPADGNCLLQPFSLQQTTV